MAGTITIIGARFGDDVFTTDECIFGREITWNVTKLRRAAEVGEFGPPDTLSMDVLPPMTEVANANIDWSKVDWMVRNCADEDGNLRGVLLEPSINVAVKIGDTTYRIPVDGNHRICARRVLGHPTWTTWSVPPEAEGRFRVHEVRR